MMQNNLLKTALCVSLLSQTIHSSQQLHCTIPQSSPEGYYLQPVKGFKKTFSQENLDTLRPDQSEDTIGKYEAQLDYNAIEAREQLTGDVIAAALSFPSEKDTKVEIWLKTLAIARKASEENIQNALNILTKELKKRSNGHPIYCNLKDENADPVNVVVHNTLHTLGWKLMHHFHKLTKPTQPIATYSSTAKLNFASTRTTTGLVPLQKIQIDGYDILAAPETLPHLGCTSADIATYLDHPKCTINVAYLDKKPVGAIVYTLPQTGYGKIELLAVITAMRKRGIASSLLSFSQEELFNHHKALVVEINVLESNTDALRCYQKNGFEISSTMANLRRSTTTTPVPEF